MKNKIPIDEFVRENLQGHQDQLNIGAWSNMERMLNGQNPYATEPTPTPDEKPNNKKWLLGLLLLLISAAGGAIYNTIHTKKTNNVLAQNKAGEALPSISNNNTNAVIPQSYNVANTSNVTDVNSDIKSNANSNINAKANSNINTIEVPNTATNNIGDNSSNVINNENTKTPLKIENVESSVVVFAKSEVASPKIVTKNNKKYANINLFKKHRSNTKITNTAIQNTELSASNMQNEVVTNKNNTESKQANSVVNKVIENTLQAETNVAETTNTIATKNSDLVSKPKKQKQSKKITNTASILKLNNEVAENIAETKNLNKVVKPSSKIKSDSITKVWVSKKVVRGLNGNKKLVIDTTNIVKIEKPIDTSANMLALAQEKEILASTDLKPQASKVKVAIEPKKSNPRYLPNAKKQDVAKQVVDTKVNTALESINNKSQATVNTNKSLAIKAIEKNIDRESKQTKPRQQDIMGTAMANAWRNAIDQIKKLGYIKIFHEKIQINPGIFMGINASAFNSQKHDFGGYQIGGNVLMKIAKNLNLVPHLSFFARNNSGYSIRDNSISVSAQSVPYNYNGNNYAVQYQYDSTVYVHNFKHLYSLESPIALQYNKKNFAVYGGVNIAYMFKMKTNNITRGYGYGNSNQNIVLDTMFNVASTTAYPFPASRGSFYKSPDFNSRLGFGYIAGINYHFTPNFYIDARVTQNLWDNSTTPSSIEMSKKMFRLPSYQISLGYRFKENSN